MEVVIIKFFTKIIKLPGTLKSYVFDKKTIEEAPETILLKKKLRRQIVRDRKTDSTIELYLSSEVHDIMLSGDIGEKEATKIAVEHLVEYFTKREQRFGSILLPKH